MNQVFDINRWILLTGKHWNENRKKYLLSLAALGGLLLIWFSFLLMIEKGHPMHPAIQIGTYYFGLLITGCLFGSMLFADLAATPRAIDYLSVPASIFEKWLTALFFGALIFFICYNVIFYLVDISLVNVANAVTSEPDKVVNIFELEGFPKDHIFHYILYIFFGVQGAFILGSVYFPAYSFIKTSIVIMIFFVFFLFFIGKVLGSIMPAGSLYESLTAYRINKTDGQDYIVRLPQWINTVLVFLFQFSIAPVLWIVTLIRLKEKEV